MQVFMTCHDDLHLFTLLPLVTLKVTFIIQLLA
jgi:hypothetical protein